MGQAFCTLLLFDLLTALPLVLALLLSFRMSSADSDWDRFHSNACNIAWSIRHRRQVSSLCGFQGGFNQVGARVRSVLWAPWLTAMTTVLLRWELDLQHSPRQILLRRNRVRSA